MDNINKIINGLTSCSKWFNGDDGEACDNCPYHTSWEWDGHDCLCEVLDNAAAKIKEQKETIDQLNRYVNGFSKDTVVPVRCKDCKKRYDSMQCPVAFIADMLKNTKVFEYKVDDDWFCADGKRKDD